MKNYLFLVVLCLAVAGCNTPKEKPQVAVKKKSPPYIQPPLPAADVAYENYTFEAEKGTTVAYRTGSQIVIPANALLDEAGKPVKGTVKLAYREFHDALDVAMSGIPMQYDSAGTRQSLQTAGMFDIRASQAGKNLHLAAGKQAQIRMASWQSDADYNFYNLDTVKRNWAYQTREKVEINQTKIVMKTAVEQMRAQVPATRFVLNLGNAFDISVEEDYDKIKQDALKKAFTARFQGYKVQYTNEMYAYTPIQIMGQGEHPAHDLVWELVGQTQTLPALRAFKNEESNKHFEAIPTHIGNGVYQFSVYRGWKNRDDTKGKVEAYITAKPIMRIASLLAHSPEKWRAEEAQLLEKIRIEEEHIKQVADVFRPIAVSNFGIHNFDRYMKDDMKDKAVFVDASFKINGTQEVLSQKKLKKIIFINPAIRSSAEYARGNWNMFGMVQDSKVRIFALLDGYQVAIVEPTEYNRIDFKKLQPDASRKDRAAHEFTLHLQTDLVKSQADLRKALQMN